MMLTHLAGYTHFIEGTGSILQTSEDLDVNSIFPQLKSTHNSAVDVRGLR